MKAIYPICWLLFLVFVDDNYINQVIATAFFCVLVIGVWMLRYIRWPLIAMACYLTAQSLLLPTDPGLGYFAPKEVIYWSIIFTFIYATHFTFKSAYFVPILALLYLCGVPFLANRSLDLAYMMALLPFAPAWQLGLVLPLMVFKGSGLSAWAMLPIIMLRHRLRWSCLAGTGAVLWGTLHPDDVLVKFSPGDRWDMWVATVDYFLQHCNVWIGAGLGTFMVHGRAIQASINVPSGPGSEIWFSLHNDYLQWLFETGVVGFVLGLLLLGTSLARLSKACQITLLSVCVCAFGYFPLDCPAFQLLIAWLLLQANFYHPNCALTAVTKSVA